MRLFHPTPEGGAGHDDETQGDPAAEAAGAVAGDDDGSGADDGSDTARAEADRQRDDYIAQAVQRGIEAGLSRIASERQSGEQRTRGGDSPTPQRSGRLAQLEHEAQSIGAERERLNRAIASEGLTAQNLYDQNQLTMRFAEFTAQAQVFSQEQAETQRQTESVAGSDDAAKKRAWSRYAADNPGIPVRFLRPAFEKEYAEANPGATKEKPSTGSRPAAAARPSVNLSGAGEVTAQQMKQRVTSQASFDREMAAAEDADDFAKMSELSRARRSGRLIVKG
jgi:hypothetical protein